MAANRLYQRALQASRQAAFYTHMGIPDTLDGRFDLAALHVCLLMDRLPGEMTQPLFDAMFRAIDTDLREQGVDMSVRKYILKMMKAFNGRIHGYRTALMSGDIAALETALTRNVWRMDAGRPDGVAGLAAYTVAARAMLAAQPLETLMQGEAAFPVPAGISAEPLRNTAHG